MNLPFNEKKATQAAAYLLEQRGGTMSYLKLLKLLYLGDRAALLSRGRPISTDRYVSMDHGPVLSRIYNLLLTGDAPGDSSFWTHLISAPENYEVHLKRKPQFDELSETETSILDDVFLVHGKKSRWELVEFTHTLPEWTNPEGSSFPITYQDILRAGEKSESEIFAIEGELEELVAVDFLLPTRG